MRTETRETGMHVLHMEREEEEHELEQLIQTTMLLKRKSLKSLGVHCHLKSPVGRVS